MVTDPSINVVALLCSTSALVSTEVRNQPPRSTQPQPLWVGKYQQKLGVNSHIMRIRGLTAVSVNFGPTEGKRNGDQRSHICAWKGH